ncbi:uncharacterized protein CDAR_376051 [Caerostris darwini]|uniref:Fibronectin type-III domain-containing protein n=1 Tax=Caerostris darwini TaxID=1538125 RepID=A0AAV4UHT0_9ARAC|nr:uncharacterized protein CDAR_376051 [Caerostris darwini]
MSKPIVEVKICGSQHMEKEFSIRSYNEHGSGSPNESVQRVRDLTSEYRYNEADFKLYDLRSEEELEEVKPQEDKQVYIPNYKSRIGKNRKFRKSRRQHPFHKFVSEEKKEEQLGGLPNIFENKQIFHQTKRAQHIDEEQLQRAKPALNISEQPLGPINLTAQTLDNRCVYMKWRQPKNAEKSQVRGYLIETWLKSEQRWLEVKRTTNTKPAAKLCNLSSQYNVLRVRAYNDFGIAYHQHQMVRPKLYHGTMDNETRVTPLSNMSASPLIHRSGRAAEFPDIDRTGDLQLYDDTNVTDFESSVEFSNATPQIEEPSIEDHANKTAYRSRFDPEVSDYDSSVDRESRLGIEGEEYDDGEVYRPRLEQLDSSQDEESYLKQYEEDDDKEMYRPHLKQQITGHSENEKDPNKFDALEKIISILSEKQKDPERKVPQYSSEVISEEEDKLGKLPNLKENQVYEMIPQYSGEVISKGKKENQFGKLPDNSDDDEGYLKKIPEYSGEVISEEKKENQFGKLPDIFNGGEGYLKKKGTEESSSDDAEVNVVHDVYVDDNQDDDEMESESVKKGNKSEKIPYFKLHAEHVMYEDENADENEAVISSLRNETIFGVSELPYFAREDVEYVDRHAPANFFESKKGNETKFGVSKLPYIAREDVEYVDRHAPANFFESKKANENTFGGKKRPYLAKEEVEYVDRHANDVFHKSKKVNGKVQEDYDFEDKENYKKEKAQNDSLSASWVFVFALLQKQETPVTSTTKPSNQVQLTSQTKTFKSQKTIDHLIRQEKHLDKFRSKTKTFVLHKTKFHKPLEPISVSDTDSASTSEDTEKQHEDKKPYGRDYLYKEDTGIQQKDEKPYGRDYLYKEVVEIPYEYEKHYAGDSLYKEGNYIANEPSTSTVCLTPIPGFENEECVEKAGPEVISKCIDATGNIPEYKKYGRLHNFFKRKGNKTFIRQKTFTEICLKEIFDRCNYDANFQIKLKSQQMVGVDLHSYFNEEFEMDVCDSDSIRQIISDIKTCHDYDLQVSSNNTRNYTRDIARSVLADAAFCIEDHTAYTCVFTDEELFDEMMTNLMKTLKEYSMSRLDCLAQLGYGGVNSTKLCFMYLDYYRVEQCQKYFYDYVLCIRNGSLNEYLFKKVHDCFRESYGACSKPAVDLLIRVLVVAVVGYHPAYPNLGVLLPRNDSATVSYDYYYNGENFVDQDVNYDWREWKPVNEERGLKQPEFHIQFIVIGLTQPATLIQFMAICLIQFVIHMFIVKNLTQPVFHIQFIVIGLRQSIACSVDMIEEWSGVIRSCMHSKRHNASDFERLLKTLVFCIKKTPITKCHFEKYSVFELAVDYILEIIQDSITKTRDITHCMSKFKFQYFKEFAVKYFMFFKSLHRIQPENSLQNIETYV